MPLYRNADRMVLFQHIPKTGGSTVEEVLQASGASQALKHHRRLGYAFATPQHMHWEVVSSWIPRGFYDYGFAVVRNPFARVVSEYRWRQSLAKTPLPDFDAWVGKNLRRYPEQTYLFDNHMRPQHEFVGDGIEVFRLEDGLAGPVHAGLTALGLPTGQVEIHHARKSKHGPLPASQRIIERCATFYAKDFETFGYCAQDVPPDLFVARTPQPQEDRR